MNALPHTYSPTPLFSVSLTATKIDNRLVTLGFSNTIVKALKSDGLANTLKRNALSILTAPSNHPFIAMPAGNQDVVLKTEDKNQLLGLFTYHVGPGEVTKIHDAGILLEIWTIQFTILAADATLGETIDVVTVTKVDDISNFGIIYSTDEAMHTERLFACSSISGTGRPGSCFFLTLVHMYKPVHKHDFYMRNTK